MMVSLNEARRPVKLNKQKAGKRKIIAGYEQLGDAGWCFWPNGARHSQLQPKQCGLGPKR
jgi:hypothetical protein